MEAFPSSLEHSLAQALLVLSSSSPSCNDEPSPDFSSSSSSDLSSDCSSRQIGADPLRILAMAGYYVERKMKIVKGRRSKMHCISDRQRLLSVKRKKKTELKYKEVSVLSNSSCSSTVTDGSSCNRVRIGKGPWKCVMVGPRRKPGRAELTRLRIRAVAIMELLSRGCASEIRIRAALGDSPDTSKALRMLLRLKEVKRSGAGGQRDPFLYAHFLQCLIVWVKLSSLHTLLDLGWQRPCSKVDSACTSPTYNYSP